MLRGSIFRSSLISHSALAAHRLVAVCGSDLWALISPQYCILPSKGEADSLAPLFKILPTCCANHHHHHHQYSLPLHQWRDWDQRHVLTLDRLTPCLRFSLTHPSGTYPNRSLPRPLSKGFSAWQISKRLASLPAERGWVLFGLGCLWF